VSKRITVYSNDPENPKLALTLKGEIVLEVNIKPYYLSFGEVRVDEKPTKTFEAEVLEPNRVKIKSVKIEDERFHLGEPQSSSAGKFSWEVSFKGTKEKGRIYTKAIFELDGSENPRLELPIRANIVGNLKYPGHIYLMKTGDAYKPRTVKIVSRKKDHSFKVKSATDPDHNVKLDLKRKSETETELTVSIKNPEKKLTEPMKGKIQIKTTDNIEPSIEIPYTATVRYNSSKMKRRALESRNQIKPSVLKNLTKKTPDGVKAQKQ
jgi:hypothetical protein